MTEQNEVPQNQEIATAVNRLFKIVDCAEAAGLAQAFEYDFRLPFRPLEGDAIRKAPSLIQMVRISHSDVDSFSCLVSRYEVDLTNMQGSVALSVNKGIVRLKIRNALVESRDDLSDPEIIEIIHAVQRKIISDALDVIEDLVINDLLSLDPADRRVVYLNNGTQYMQMVTAEAIFAFRNLPEVQHQIKARLNLYRGNVQE